MSADLERGQAPTQVGDTTYSGGSAFITDPETGDSIQLRGATEAALKAHPKDFAFG